MRSRHTLIALSTWPASSSASEWTGSGAFTITSWAPSAGLDANRSGSPRPPASGSEPGSGSPADSAGYRFGTTRTRHPPLAPGRVYSSGGVRSSCPAANGSPSRSIGGRGGTSSQAPGREPRSPATITRSPDRGSMRSSGKALLHRHVLDALLGEAGAALLVAGVEIELQRVGLRVQRHGPRRVPPRHAVRLPQDRGGDPGAAPVRLHGQPAERGNPAAEQQPARAHHALVLDRHDVDGLVVAAVAVRRHRHALLDAEHPLAQVERGVELGIALYGPDVQGSASVAVDVLGEVGLARVAADVDVLALAVRAVVGRHGEALHAVERGGYLLVRVLEVVIRDRVVREELQRVGPVVVGVHPDEGDLAPALLRLVPEEGELVAAGPAPRRPLVDHHRLALFRDVGLEGVDASWEVGARTRGLLFGVGTARRERKSGKGDGEQAHRSEASHTHFGCSCAVIGARRRTPQDHRRLRRSRDSESGGRRAGPAEPRRSVPPATARPVPFPINKPLNVADASSALVDAPVSGDVLARAEEFAREAFVLPGEDPAQALAKGTARRKALDAALAEIDAGREEPSVEWRREFSLMLGLERVLSEGEPPFG